MSYGNPVLVERAISRPNHCAVLPSLGAAHARGYFDTGVDLQGFDNRVYVSVEAVEVMARKLGWVGPETIADHDTQVADLEREVSLLRDQLRDADQFAEAAEYTLSRFGQRVQKKPGRKPREPVQ